MTTTGERLVAISPLTSATMIDHLFAVSAGGATIVTAPDAILVDTEAPTVVEVDDTPTVVVDEPEIVIVVEDSQP